MGVHKTSPRRNPITAFLPTLLFEFLKKLHKTEAWCHFVGNRQKGESQSRCFKKTKHAKFSKNEHFLPPDTHTYVCVSGGKKCPFFRNLPCFFFLKHPLWDSPFCLITDDLLLNLSEMKLSASYTLQFQTRFASQMSAMKRASTSWNLFEFSSIVCEVNTTVFFL